VANPTARRDTPPLTSEIAAAIRATWPKTMRQTYAETPGFFTHCACQYGTTPPCQKGRHDRCGRAEPLRSTETSICRKNFTVTNLPEPYQNPSDVSTTGPGRTRIAQVWLADRVCRWQCTCDCHTPAPSTTEPPPAASTTGLPRPANGQTDLFDLIGATQ
jgi:hypothetical protein